VAWWAPLPGQVEAPLVLGQTAAGWLSPTTVVGPVRFDTVADQTSHCISLFAKLPERQSGPGQISCSVSAM
jgi:hypothetical protein